jgi:hypothetical protein
MRLLGEIAVFGMSWMVVLVSANANANAHAAASTDGIERE